MSKLYNLTHDIAGQSEDELQQKCVYWFHNDYPTLRGCLFSVPNGGLRNKREAKKLKQTGAFAGVSDLLFLYKGKTYPIELKKKGGRQSKSQVEWELRVLSHGFPYIIIDSLEVFKSTIKSIINSYE